MDALKIELKTSKISRKRWNIEVWKVFLTKSNIEVEKSKPKFLETQFLQHLRMRLHNIGYAILSKVFGWCVAFSSLGIFTQ